MAEQKITNWVAPDDKTGEFKRGQSQFRNFIKKGGEFPPEKGRYHLYVSYACPWAHRTLIVRKLKGLEDIIPYTSVHWHMAEKGWRFATAEDNDAPGDNQGKIVSNESSEIIRMFYTEFDDIIAPEYKSVDLFPASLQKEIEATNDGWTYNDINNGVYRSGFATKPEAYEKAVINSSLLWIGFDVVYVQHFKTNIRDIRSGTLIFTSG
ncbi:hypothetical protein DID88_005446 [Monilinia fructigena]|uniref:Uncharacterized protein n=1 Tax=Monilinia fructigena TaxID=38457 RepID=A0A395J044_9HELO|nr:hypothetical protein DID88_005446 [Monilinia fructigena]